MPRLNGLLAFAMAAITVGCQSSADRARIEMQPVYRSAKTLSEQMKAVRGHAGRNAGQAHGLSPYRRLAVPTTGLHQT